MDETRSLVISMAIDPVAECALRIRAEDAEKAKCECDACGEVIEGEPAGSGLYVWFRGDEMRCEEPPLCRKCATAIGLTALALFSMEEEGEG